MVRIVVRDFEEAGRAFERFRSIVIEAAQTKSLVLAERILSTAIDLCPKDTGALAASGRLELLGEGEALIKFGGSEFTNPRTLRPVLYARFVHEGTSRMSPRPFVRWAISIHTGEWAREVVEEVRTLGNR